MNAASDPAQIQPRLWPSVWKLLRLRLVIFASGFRRAKVRRKIGMAILAVLVAAGMVLAFVLSWLLLRFLRSPDVVQYIGNNSEFLVNIPVMVVSAAFVMILLTSFGVLLQALYLAGDMDFLLSAPLPIRAIFVAKLLQAILPNFGLILLFSLPVLYGLGASAGYNVLYYPLVFLVLALLALATAGLSSLLVMVVVRIFPARRVAEILGFLAAIFSMICSQSSQFVNYADMTQAQATQAISMATRFNTPWSPLAWAGRGLVEVGEGNWLSGAALILLTVTICAAIFAVSLVTAERLYYSGWASVQVSARKKKTSRARRRNISANIALGGWMNRILPAHVRGIMTKDFRMLQRDLRNMSQLVTPLIFGILYAFLLIRRGGEIPAGRGEAPPIFMEALSNLMVYANVGISLFVGFWLLSRLATMGFSQEGKHYWLLKSAPVSTRQLLTAKYLVAYLPTLGLGLVFLVVISLLQQTSLATFIFSALVILLCMAGLAGLNLAFGVVGARFDWEDPRRIALGSAGCLGVLASSAFLVISLGLFFGPSLIVGIFIGGSQAAGQWIGLFLGGAFSLAIGFISLWSVRNRVPRLAET